MRARVAALPLRPVMFKSGANPGAYGRAGQVGMLLVLELDVADLAATRFAISPLGETLRAVQLGQPEPARGVPALGAVGAGAA